MARGKDRGAPLGGGGVGPPPTAASSALPRRLTRASASLAAGNLRPAEATAGKQRLPGSAAASTVGKHTDLKVGAAPAPAPAPVSASASSGLSKEEECFVNNFLYLMNCKPSELYKLYADDAELNWNFDGRRIELKTNETIGKFLSDAAPQRQFDAVDCKVQSVVNLNSSLLTVYGICDALDCKPRIFVQTFVLRRPDLLILNDALTVLLLCVPESDISKKPQRRISNNRCGVCNKEWHSSDPKSWVQCSNCLTWLHIECDPLCCDDVEILEKLNYLCPFCMSQFQSILAVQHTSTGIFSEPIPVSCLAKHGVYMPEKNKVLCHCNDCSEEAKLRSMTAWERHCGSDKKKWKSSVYLKGTNDLLFDFLNKNPVGSVKLSKTAEVNPSLSFKPSTTCAKTSDYPNVSCSRMMDNKESRESNFCILYDYDAMKWHQDGDKDHFA
ncbi:hypothetical protein ACQJBY_027904 [Aegilops geniculata]